MGKRQNKNTILFRTYGLVVFMILINSQCFSQKAKISMNLQNGFFYEMPSFEEQKQILIEEKSYSECDSLIGILKPFFIKQTRIDTTIKYWKLNTFLSFDYEDGVYSIVKVQKNRGSLVIGYNSFGFFKKEKCWEQRDVKELSNIQTAIQYLKPSTFWAFYNQDKSNIPEIDQIKAQFKDSEGILDIDKLGAYLKTKPKALAKYCDF